MAQLSDDELRKSLEPILARYPQPEGELLALLHDVQHTLGYIPREAIDLLASHVKMSPATLYGVITFYADFRRTPPAGTTIHICQGPACQLRGAEGILRAIEGYLGVKPGEQTSDGKIGLEIAQCPGICHQAPQLYLNDELQPKMRPSQVVSLLKRMQGASS